MPRHNAMRESLKSPPAWSCAAGSRARSKSEGICAPPAQFELPRVEGRQWFRECHVLPVARENAAECPEEAGRACAAAEAAAA